MSETQPQLTAPRILLSGTALEKVREMLEEADLPDEGGLRLSARPGAGCSAPLQYDMVLDEAPDSDDTVLTVGNLRLFVDPRSAWSLDGLLVDYVTSPVMGEGFAFRRQQGNRGRAC